MKNLFFFTFLFILSGPVLAQGIKIAPMVGINITNSIFSSSFKDILVVDYENGSTKYNPVLKFSVGGIADFAYAERLSFRSGLLLNLKGAQIKVTESSADGRGSIKEKYTFSYLEIPLWVAYRLGETGFSIIGGPNIGFAMKAKAKTKGSYTLNGSTESYDNGYDLEIGGDENEDQVKPLDISLNIGLAKEIMLAERPLEVSVNIQPSLSKWTTASKVESDIWGRHLVIGLRAAYFFSIR